jgi:nitric oxide reductase NorD protein
VSTPSNEHVVSELRAFPAALLSAYEEALEQVAQVMGPAPTKRWGEEGVRIAKLDARAWEAAAEYYRATPEVCGVVGYPQFERWTESGAELAGVSPLVAAAYFRASGQVLPQLAPRHISAWAGLGKGLSSGTWKSSSLAARFFELSPELVGNLSFNELQQFVGLLSSLSNRSHDLASEALTLGQRVLPAVGEREELISLASVLAETSWREVRGSFEAALRVELAVDRRLRRRYFSLAERLARMGMPNVSAFMIESSSSLSRLPQDIQQVVVERAEDLADTNAEAVGAFLRSAPDVLSRISTSQLDAWFAKGLEFLKENPDGGVAYFKLESARAEALLEQLSSAIELERVKPTLGMYAHALAGSEVDIHPTGDLTTKHLGWADVDMATTDGHSIYLPPQVDGSEVKAENFAWLKVVATHQIGHIEFGSFGFDFGADGHRFTTLRRRVAEGVKAQPTSTSVGGFFDMFPERELAADLFKVVESARVDSAVTGRYQGLATDYRKVQAGALAKRGLLQNMPAQQAMVELAIRLSLGQDTDVPVPSAYAAQAQEVAALVRAVQDPDATVEDAAEAALRLYHVISQVPNHAVPAHEWERVDLTGDAFSEPDPEAIIANLLRQADEASEQSGGEGEDYSSPEEVEYRGDFKPEMVQMLTKMRAQSSDESDAGDEGAAGISMEMVEQMLRESGEVEVSDDEELSEIASNMMKEMGADAQQTPGSGYNDITHVDEEGGSLEATEPQSYAYDEWDFRAGDYRPRWCIVQERVSALGETGFFTDTLHQHAGLMDQIRRQFESVRPELYRKVRRLPEGEDVDLDAGIDALIDLRNRMTPDERIYWRRNKDERDVAVAFLLDMSASTAEAVEESTQTDWSPPTDPVGYTSWLRARRGETARRPYKRIIDVEKESMVLLMTALEAVGDRYGVYGFSGFGRENVEFYVIKEVDEPFTDKVKRRMDKVSPLHATRMGPAIRHATAKLAKTDAKTKFMFVISDGRPQDRGYSREGVEKEYAVQDTRMALMEARQRDITPFCLTVDRNGHDYLRTMAGDLNYEVLPDILELPRRLPYLYRKITV